MRVAGVVTVVVALLIVAGAVAWYAGERHYDNCVQAAVARYPVIEEPKPQGIVEEYERFKQERRGGETEASSTLDARGRAIDDCSRVPFS